jgi:adenosine deaminase
MVFTQKLRLGIALLELFSHLRYAPRSDSSSNFATFSRMDEKSRNDEEVTIEFCKSLPKIELHSHLNGSIRISTLEELIEKAGGTPFASKTRTLEDCFQLFNLIHKHVVSSEHIRRVIREVVEDYVAENTIYLELRTTPRALSDFIAEGKRKYVEVLLEEVKEINEKYAGKIEVRILLSVNRRYPVEEAKEIVDLAIEMKEKSEFLVGVDFSGHPNADGFSVFKDLFDQVRASGLKISVHFAEVFNSQDTREILDFAPDRLGHGCCIDEENHDLFFSKRIPLEICPTSNLMTRPEIDSYSNHPVGDLLEVNYPVSINTDDRGVFNVSLSQEYFNVASAFKLSKQKLIDLTLTSVDHTFSNGELGKHLKEQYIALN